MKRWQFGLSEGGSSVQEGIVVFHNDLMCLLVLVVCFVSFLLLRLVGLWSYNS